MIGADVGASIRSSRVKGAVAVTHGVAEEEDSSDEDTDLSIRDSGGLRADFVSLFHPLVMDPWCWLVVFVGWFLVCFVLSMTIPESEFCLIETTSILVQ